MSWEGAIQDAIQLIWIYISLLVNQYIQEDQAQHGGLVALWL